MVTTDLGNEFATLDRELPEAVHRTKRVEDRNATAVVDRGIQTLKKDLERPLRAGGRGLQRPAARDGVRRPQGRGEAAGHRVPAAAGQRRQVPFRAPTNAARSFNPQYGDVQQLRAVDSMTVRSTEGPETLLKLALPAPQGSGNAAGRLTRRGRPAAVRQLDDFEAQDPRLIKPCFGGKKWF